MFVPDTACTRSASFITHPWISTVAKLWTLIAIRLIIWPWWAFAETLIDTVLGTDETLSLFSYQNLNGFSHIFTKTAFRVYCLSQVRDTDIACESVLLKSLANNSLLRRLQGALCFRVPSSFPFEKSEIFLWHRWLTLQITSQDHTCSSNPIEQQ